MFKKEGGPEPQTVGWGSRILNSAAFGADPSGGRIGRMKDSRTRSHYLHGSQGTIYPEYSDSQGRRESRYSYLQDWRRIFSLRFADLERERKYERWIWAKHRDRWAITIWAMFFWTLVLFALFFTKGLTGELGPCANIDEWGYCQDEQRLAANKADYPWVIEIILLFAGCVVPYLGVFFLLRFMDPDKLSHYIHYIWTFTTIWATGASLGIRSFIVDPDGDAMFYSLLDLTAVVVIPMVTSLPFHCTLLLVVINLIAVVAILWTRFASKLLGSSVCAFLYIFVGTFTILIHVRDNEKEERRRYIAETELRYMNAGLKDRLAGLQRQLSEQMADLETPLEKALITIKSVMANPRLDKSSFDHLAKALGWLGNSNKLFTPNLEQQLHGGLVGVNKDQEQWLLQMLSDQLGHRRKQPGHRTQPPMTSRLGGGGAMYARNWSMGASYVFLNSHDNLSSPTDRQGTPDGPSASMTHSGSFALPPSSHRIALNQASDDRGRPQVDSISWVGAAPLPSIDVVVDMRDPSNPSSPRRGRPTAPHKPGLPRISMARRNSLCEGMDDWNWAIFELEKVMPSRVLSTMAMHLCRADGLADRLQIPAVKLHRFLEEVENLYHPDVPYHNSIHAGDVLHGLHCILLCSNTNLSDLELFASYIAAAIHDVNHPGLNNKFLIETHDPLAVLYNDRSVLENHHLATAFSIMYQEDTNIVENFSLDDAHKFRELVISMVLATDVTNHFTKLAMFKNKLSAPGAFDPANNTEDRNLFLEMAIKCADVSNLSREWPVYFEWLNRLILEFLNQGDEERRRGMPVSPFMDREKINIPQSQIGFIDYMCLPMFEVLAKATPLPPMLELLAENREKLSLMKDEDAKQNMAGFSKVVRTSEIDD